MKLINELRDGDHIYGNFLVASCTKGVTTGSKNYLTIMFQDASGTMEAKRWDFLPEDPETFAPGNVVFVEAEVISYKDHLQMKVFNGSKVPFEEIDVTQFVPAAPIPREELEKKLDEYLDSLKNEEVAALTKYLVEKFRKDFVVWPAAVRNHHNFASGLLYHSLTMAAHAEAVCAIYPSLNRDVLIAGCLIHDLGKTIELSGPVAPAYTLEGKLLGHISIMQAEIREAAHALNIQGEIPVILEHMILSHHGQPDFGSAVMPLTREALVLAMIDDMDAKMNILDKALAEVNPGEFTQRIYPMDDRFFYCPEYSKK